MRKFIAMFICAVLAIGTAAAQNSKTYTGFVVDKNGNPVVGAEVMAPGGGASTITDSDGSFSIEVPFMLKKLTASYTGMREKTLKLGNSSNLVFKMKGLKKMAGFISFIGNVGFSKEKYESSDFGNEDSSDAPIGAGIMGGQIGQLSSWGWYVKGIGGVTITDVYGYASFTAGAIRKLAKKTHIYFGGGVAYVYDGPGFSIDLGTIFDVSDHVNVIAGLNYMNATANEEYYKEKYNLINLNIGVGYTF